jgi:hypothetical protein
MAKNIKENTGKPLNLADLSSSKHSDPQTFIVEIHRNLVLYNNQNSKLLYLIADFKREPEKISVLGQSFFLKENGHPVLNDINVIPNLNVRPVRDGYVVYFNRENDVQIVGHAAEGKYIHLPIIHRHR